MPDTSKDAWRAWLDAASYPMSYRQWVAHVMDAWRTAAADDLSDD